MQLGSMYVECHVFRALSTLYPSLLNRYLIIPDVSWPTGLAFSPDSSKLYLADSSPESPAWYVYDVAEDGSLSNGRVFLDAKELQKVGGY